MLEIFDVKLVHTDPFDFTVFCTACKAFWGQHHLDELVCPTLFATFTLENTHPQILCSSNQTALHCAFLGSRPKGPKETQWPSLANYAL